MEITIFLSPHIYPILTNTLYKRVFYGPFDSALLETLQINVMYVRTSQCAWIQQWQNIKYKMVRFLLASL